MFYMHIKIYNKIYIKKGGNHEEQDYKKYYCNSYMLFFCN